MTTLTEVPAADIADGLNRFEDTLARELAAVAQRNTGGSAGLTELALSAATVALVRGLSGKSGGITHPTFARYCAMVADGRSYEVLYRLETKVHLPQALVADTAA